MDHSAQGLEYLKLVQAQIKEEGLSWTAGHTPLLDLSPDELEVFLSAGPPSEDEDMETEPAWEMTLDKKLQIPRKLDWRSIHGQNYITPVKSQGGCGSCGAFAAIAATEARLRIANRSPDFAGKSSVMPILSEANAYFCHGASCSSGVYVNTVLTNIEQGVVTEDDLPYSRIVSSKSSSCDLKKIDCYADCQKKIGTPACLINIGGGKPSDHYTKLASHRQLRQKNNEPISLDLLKQMIFMYGPLGITYQIRKSFIVYKSGIYRGLKDELPFKNHAICLIGYNDDEQCFIFKNSWGTGFGEDGFGKMAYDDPNIRIVDQPLDFKQVYTKHGILYDDIYMRDNLDDYGQPFVDGAVHKSPDIIPNGERPMPDHRKTLADNWFADVGKNVINGVNYIYTRGNSLSTKKEVAFQVYLYYCRSSLLMYPGQWKNNRIPTASNKTCAVGVAKEYGSLAVPDEPFVWKPEELPFGEHYCLIGRIVTPDHPNPVPDIDKIDDFARFIAGNPGYAWRNVTIVKSDISDLTEIIYYQHGQQAGEIYFLVDADENAPVGASFTLSCAASKMSFEAAGRVSAPGLAIGTHLLIPAEAEGNIVFSYNKGDFKEKRGWSLKIRAVYLPQQQSPLLETCQQNLIDLPRSENEAEISPRKGILVGEYVIQGSEA